jgi:cellulose synthase/poly-beta-1,6-N-acetylglucosamine synthase-like glycosyltransferase
LPEIVEFSFGAAGPRQHGSRTPQVASSAPELPSDIAFLTRHGIPFRVLELAARLAAWRGTAARDELFAVGFERSLYWKSLANDLGLPFASDLRGARLAPGNRPTVEAVRLARAALVEHGGRHGLVLAPGGAEIERLRRRLRAAPALAPRITIAPPEAIRHFLATCRRGALAYYAVHRLTRTMPRLSSRALGLARGAEGPIALAAAVLGLCLLTPGAAIVAATLLFTAFFLNCAVWKLAAAVRRAKPLRLQPIPTDRLPTYTALVPLYREAEVAAELVRHLGAVDYPASKLQVLLLIEADDAETRIALTEAALPPNFGLIVVPPGGPRTKPKALTYALPFAHGELVVVFDAEDRPEPDQLRKAAAAFREDPSLGCVQARLRPDNEGSLLARLFTVEYAANFEVLLPALASWDAPLPLGGTSNHFPRAVLEKVGAWDPFNVTEDADLGIRLARFGYRSATILSRTYEEAPVTFRQWLPQRRRWIKGWMQTSLVCSGWTIPRGLGLPLRGCLAVHGIVTAGVLGLLLYPFSLAVLLLSAIAIARDGWPDEAWHSAFLALNFGNVLAILLSAGVSAIRGLAAARALHLVPLVPLLPLYWALMSLAAWQALFQLGRNRSAWEKTAHGVARDRRAPAMMPEF